MSEHFKLEEFLRSDTAKEQKIENLPSWDVIKHLDELACFLDGLRDAWGGPIKVTSGYRSTALNGAVGGDNRSAHKLGYAADLQPSARSFDKFKECVVNWIKDKNYDQCIIEHNKSGVYWVHLALYNQDGKQRRDCFSLSV